MEFKIKFRRFFKIVCHTGCTIGNYKHGFGSGVPHRWLAIKEWALDHCIDRPMQFQLSSSCFGSTYREP